MTRSLRATILGCGSSGGVPRLGGRDGSGDWGACDPGEPRNRRTRCSLLVEAGNFAATADGTTETPDGATADRTTRLLIDTSPDLRAQLLAARIDRLDAVLITHDHADQTHGLDDLRPLSIRQRMRIPVHLSRQTSGQLLMRFGYCFEQPNGSWYPPMLDEIPLPPDGTTFLIDGPGGGVAVTPFLQDHGAVRSHGFRIGDLAYSADVVDLPDESFAVLDGVKVWIVDCLQMTPHGSHAHYDKTLEWIARVRPQNAILTNLHVTMDYQTLVDRLPPGVTPAHDGMVIELPG